MNGERLNVCLWCLYGPYRTTEYTDNNRMKCRDHDHDQFAGTMNHSSVFTSEHIHRKQGIHGYPAAHLVERCLSGAPRYTGRVGYGSR
jgi:hypothetical protein